MVREYSKMRGNGLHGSRFMVWMLNKGAVTVGRDPAHIPCALTSPVYADSVLLQAVSAIPCLRFSLGLRIEESRRAMA